jgi:hypothetical protein
MADKKTYRIDENALRDKLTNYTVSYNADSFNFLENEVAQVKTSKPIELPDSKKLLQFIGIPVAIALLGCGIYFGFNYIKNLPASAPKKDTVTVTKPAEPKTEEKKEVPPPITTPSVVTNTEEKKKDTVIAVAPQPVAQPIKTKEKKNTSQPVVTAVKKDSGQVNAIAKSNIDSVEKKNKVDTISVNKNNNGSKKKKKKRKSLLDATEDIRQSQPSSAEDEVVVPDNTPKQ